MTKYIAEIGLNHLGDPKLGFQLVKKAVASGVDGVSIQFMPESYYDNSKPWRRKIDSKFYKKISDFLKKKKISFGIGVIDIDALRNYSDLKIDFWKIISYAFYNEKLIAALKKEEQLKV